jgi:hypothetical protein
LSDAFHFFGGRRGLLIGASPGFAETYYVDAYDALGGQTVLNSACVGGCSVGGFSSGLFSFEPGDVIDLGYLTIYPYRLGGRGVTSSIIGGYGCLTAFKFLYLSKPLRSMFARAMLRALGTRGAGPLVFVMPDDQTEISVNWAGPFSYIPGAVPPMPEPSTWAMLLIGFAGIGFAGYRRTKLLSTET